MTLNSIRLAFMKKTSMPNRVKSLGYIKFYKSGSPRFIKSPAVPEGLQLKKKKTFILDLDKCPREPSLGLICALLRHFDGFGKISFSSTPCSESIVAGELSSCCFIICGC